MYQIQPCFSRFLVCSRRYDNQGTVADIIETSRINLDGLNERTSMAQIHGFSLRLLMIGIDQYQF